MAAGSVVSLPAILSSASLSPPSLPTRVRSTQALPATQWILLSLSQTRRSRYPVVRGETTWPSSRHTEHLILQFPTMDKTVVVHQAESFPQSLAGSTHGQSDRVSLPGITRRILHQELLLCSGATTLESSVDFNTSGSRTGYMTGRTAKAQHRSMCRHTSWISSTVGQTQTEVCCMRPRTTVHRQHRLHQPLLRLLLQHCHQPCHRQCRQALPHPHHRPALISLPVCPAL